MGTVVKGVPVSNKKGRGTKLRWAAPTSTVRRISR